MTTALSILNGVKSWVDIEGLSIRHPLDGDPPISQVFGQISITGSIHLGVDFVCAYVPLHAVLDGYVVSTYPYGQDLPGLTSDGSPGGYGSTVYLRHVVEGVGTFHSYYCHMSRIDVHYADVVKQGQVLGISGSTGISSGPHEHFELRPLDGVTRIDPIPFINAVIIPPVPPRPTDEEWYMSLDDPIRAALELLAAEHDALISLAKRVTPLMRLADAPAPPADDISDRQRTVYTALPDDAARNRALNGAGAAVKGWAKVV